MLKKLLAGVITAVLSLGVVVLVAGPASAHHNTIKVNVVCATDGGYKVTWSVTNSESDKTEKITQSNMPAVVPINTTFGFSETKQFVQIVSEPQNLELVLTGYWQATNYYSTDKGWLGKDSFPTGCIKVTAEATSSPSVCTGPNQYSAPSYTLKAVTGVIYTVDGATKAAGTYPAVNGTTVNIVASVTDPKYELVGTKSWSFEFKAPVDPCTVTVEPVAPDFKQQVCTGPGDHSLATYTIPAVTGVLYFVKIDGGAEQPISAGTHNIPDGVNTVEVIAKGDAANYYVITGGTKIYPVFTVNPAGLCLVEIIPLTPDPTQAVCDVVNHPGVVPSSTYTLLYVPHVVYLVSTDNVNFTPVTITGNTTYPVAPGTHIYVKATVDDPTKYQTSAFAWDHLFTDPGDCKPEVTPVAPDVSHQFCDDSDPTNPILVDGAILITAATNITYYIDGNLAVVGLNPVAPGAHTVTATFDTTKYKLAPGAQTSFPVTINPGECLPTEPLVTPAVASSQIGCFSSGSYTLSNDLNDPNAVIWTVNGTQVAPGKYTVSSAASLTMVATPNAPQYGFPAGVQTTWTVNFQKPSVCDLETLALTGQSPTGLLIVADLLVVAGLALFGVRAMRRRPEMA
jgi:hypothetical protein